VWCPSDPPPNDRAEKQVGRRDPAGLYGALDAAYLSPADGFRELAHTYDQRMAGNPLFLLESTETLAALPDLTGKTAADLGCGTGRYALQLARLGAERVVGVDLVPEMLAAANRKARRGELDDVTDWREGDLTAPDGLPLADGSVDAAVCALTLSFLAEVGAAFAEMARVVRPGGVLVVSDYHPHGLCAARAESLEAAGGKDRAPYLRFTSVGGEECRVAQTPHLAGELFAAAAAAGLRLDSLAEPLVDARLANTYAGLRGRVGTPLALVMRFTRL
jgi:ubiquinone/menaquinone biosynthesis C-methylase UbiE